MVGHPCTPLFLFARITTGDATASSDGVAMSPASSMPYLRHLLCLLVVVHSIHEPVLSPATEAPAMCLQDSVRTRCKILDSRGVLVVAFERCTTNEGQKSLVMPPVAGPIKSPRYRSCLGVLGASAKRSQEGSSQPKATHSMC